MGNKAIEEAKECVRSAILNSLLDFPAKKILINLAPAEFPKDGSLCDVPIALAILAASCQLREEELAHAMFAGELALNGDIRPTKGVISIVEAAKNAGFHKAFIPKSNLDQASLIEYIEIIPVSNLKELFLHHKGEQRITAEASDSSAKPDIVEPAVLLDDIHSQDQAKRALTIAAAGRHNILFTVTPGAGKTMPANALLGLLPALSKSEQATVTKLHSLAGESIDQIVTCRPFPHRIILRAGCRWLAAAIAKTKRNQPSPPRCPILR